MKLSLEKLSLGLILAALPLVGGCNSETGNGAYGSASTAPSPAVVSAPPQAYTAPEPAVQMAAAATVDQPLPSNSNPSSPVASVIKLTQAGVGENVILSYIANSTTPFNLSPDDIIYLHDLGASDAVTTAMIQRDQALGAAAATQPAYTAPAITYVQQPARVTVVQEAPAVQDYSYFYDSLAPYGSWVEVEGYGRCWQPTVVVVNRGWQPYCDNGHWMYTDCGWYWSSDYSWGATFHYGRWFRDSRRGWCWAPDSVWGPSWVSWRYSNDYCGWAPLPPTARYASGVGFSYHGRNVDASFGFGLSSDCYTFVPASRFCDSRPWQHRAPANQVTTIYNNTTIINNIVVGNNNTIINHGVPHERIEAATHTPLRPIHVQHDEDNNSRPGRHERFDADSQTLIVNHPLPNQPATHFGRMPSQSNGSTRTTTSQPGNNAGTTGNNNSPRGNGSSQPRSDRTAFTPAGPDHSAQNSSANNNVGNNSNPGNNQPPRGNRQSPYTPAGQNQSTQNPAVNNANNSHGNNVVAPISTTSPVTNDRRDSGRQQNYSNQRPVQNASVNTAPTAITPVVQNPRIVSQDTPRYYSPRIDAQNVPARSPEFQSTTPRYNKADNQTPVNAGRVERYQRENLPAANQQPNVPQQNSGRFSPAATQESSSAPSHVAQNPAPRSDSSPRPNQDRSNNDRSNPDKDKDKNSQKDPRNQR